MILPGVGRAIGGIPMANEKKNRKRVKKPRQEWNPHWIIKLLYTVFSVALSAFKIAVGAAVTVALILIVCGIVFVGALGVRMPAAFLMSRVAAGSLFCLGLSTPASTVVQILLCLGWFLRQKNRQVPEKLPSDDR